MRDPDAGGRDAAFRDGDHHTVLIPMAWEGGAVGLVRAKRGLPSQKPPEGVSPILADLYGCRGLPEAGSVAVDATRPLDQPRPSGLGLEALGLGPHLPPVALSPVYSKSFRHLDRNRSRSAELPLSLAILMARRGARVPFVAATGALSPAEAGVAMPKARLDEILPVDGLEQKIRAIGGYFSAGDGARRGERVPVILPPRTVDRRETLVVHQADIASAVAAAAIAGVTLEFRTHETLSEAIAALGAPHPPRDPWRWIRRGVFAASLVLAVATAVVGVWASAPIALRFSGLPLGDGSTIIETPLRTHYDTRSGDGLPRPVCRTEQGVAVVEFGAELTVSIETSPTWAPLGVYDFALVFFGRHSGGKLFSMPVEGRPRKRADGAIVFGARIPIEPPAEWSLLAAIGRKLRPLDRQRIITGLDAISRSPSEDLRINRVIQLLEENSDGVLPYVFESLDELRECRLPAARG